MPGTNPGHWRFSGEHKRSAVFRPLTPVGVIIIRINIVAFPHFSCEMRKLCYEKAMLLKAKTLKAVSSGYLSRIMLFAKSHFKKSNIATL